MSVVETDRRGRITVITLNRPEKRNALTDEMNVALRDAFRRFADDSEAWVAVLAGNGPDFCAGVDLGNVRRGGDRARPGGITRGFECWKPIVAAVHGNCLGGGLELALCADIRIADPSARLGSPEVKWGLMQGAGATQRLSRFVPFAVALEMLFTGDPIDAERAERIGLVNEVRPIGQALEGGVVDGRAHRRTCPAGGAQGQGSCLSRGGSDVGGWPSHRGVAQSDSRRDG